FRYSGESLSWNEECRKTVPGRPASCGPTFPRRSRTRGRPSRPMVLSRLSPTERPGTNSLMPHTTSAESRRRADVVALNARLRASRNCHLTGYLDERESVPIARDPEPDASVPRILLVGQAPGLRATIQDRPFAGIAGDKLRAWFEKAGIPRSEFYDRI